MDDRTFSECLISPAFNYTKLVRQGDNLNKKMLVYTSYVSWLSRIFTCKFRKEPEVGCDPATEWMRLLSAGVRPTTE